MNRVTFRVNPDADVCGTCLQGTLVGNYRELVKLFGEPECGDDYKVSGEWIFESENGDCVTLYDWKSTELYDCDYPSVEEFRQQKRYEFHIGAKSRSAAEAFKLWFMDQITPKLG